MTNYQKSLTMNSNNELALAVSNANLTVVSNNIGLNKSENNYLKALINSRPMFELSAPDKKKYLLGCITAAIFIGGWNPKDDNDLFLMVNTLMPDINGKFRAMTEVEVRAAFENGSKGYYGENKGGMSVAACISWLNSYHQDVNRSHAKKQLAALNKKPDKFRPSRAQIQSLIQSSYAEFLETGVYNDHGNATYNMLDSERMINFTIAEKNSYVEKGRIIVFNRLQIYRDLKEKRENEKKLDELMESDTTAIIEAKKLALLDYFGSVKALGLVEISFVNTCLKF